MNKKQRTLKQNSSFHKWFNQLSLELNDKGVDQQTIFMRNTIKMIDHLRSEIESGREYTAEDVLVIVSDSLPFFETSWTMESVKDLWRKFQRALYQTESTTQLKTDQISVIYEHINRLTSSHGVHVPFPSFEEVVNNNLGERNG